MLSAYVRALFQTLHSPEAGFAGGGFYRLEVLALDHEDGPLTAFKYTPVGVGDVESGSFNGLGELHQTPGLIVDLDHGHSVERHGHPGVGKDLSGAVGFGGEYLEYSELPLVGDAQRQQVDAGVSKRFSDSGELAGFVFNKDSDLVIHSSNLSSLVDNALGLAFTGGKASGFHHFNQRPETDLLAKLLL